MWFLIELQAIATYLTASNDPAPLPSQIASYIKQARAIHVRAQFLQIIDNCADTL